MRIPSIAVRLFTAVSLVGGLGACEFSTPPNPAHLSNTAGSPQTVAAGTQAPMPLTVTVHDTDHEPMSGVTVHWMITEGGGTLSSPTSTTNSDGVTSVNFTAGSAKGTTQIAATVPALGAAVGFTMKVQ